MPKRAVQFAFAWVVSLCAGSARAAHVVEMALPRLADEAAHVVTGEVVSVSSAWAENPRRIETTLVLSGVAVLKGAADDVDPAGNVVIRLPGGRIGDWQQRVCCAPQFRVGEKWCLFLLPRSGLYPVVGLNQGALRITADVDGIERVHAWNGARLANIDAQGMLQFTPAASIRSLPVQIPGAAADGHSGPVIRDARNVTILPSAPAMRTQSADRPAMSAGAFLSALQPILERSRQHAARSIGQAWAPSNVTPTAFKHVSPPHLDSVTPQQAGAKRHATPSDVTAIGRPAGGGSLRAGQGVRRVDPVERGGDR